MFVARFPLLRVRLLCRMAASFPRRGSSGSFCYCSPALPVAVERVPAFLLRTEAMMAELF